MKSKLTQLQIIAIEQAAVGLISGNLSEWHVLMSAFRILELPSDPSMAATKAKNLCGLIISHPSWNL